MSTLLSVDHLGFAYRADPVLKNVSFSVQKGELRGIIGPNGSGKSTLLKLMAGYLKPQHGQIRLNDADLHRLSPPQVARSLAVVRQDLHSDVELTVEELVMLGRFPYLPPWGGESAHDQQIVRDNMRLTGIEHLADRRLSEISGGERQRAFFAQALSQEPQLLLLDEATSHLDIRHQLATMDLARRLSQERQLAIVAVMHDLNLASLYCDRLALLSEGQLLTEGAVGSVLTQAWVKRAYATEVLIVPHPVNGRPQISLIPGVNEQPHARQSVPDELDASSRSRPCDPAI